MNRRTSLFTLTAAAAVLIGSGWLVSNSATGRPWTSPANPATPTGAFLVNLPLEWTGTPSGTQTIGLPFNKSLSLVTIGDLHDDIQINSTPPGPVCIQQWIRATDSLRLYCGSPTDPAVTPLLNAVDKAEGFFVKVSQDMVYTIVGTHDPAHTVVLRGPGSSASGTQLFAIPYHSTATDLKDLIDEINTNGTPPGNVISIGQWIRADDSLLVYSGAPTDPPAPAIEIARSYFLRVTANTAWVPQHF